MELQWKFTFVFSCSEGFKRLAKLTGNTLSDLIGFLYLPFTWRDLSLAQVGCCHEDSFRKTSRILPKKISTTFFTHLLVRPLPQVKPCWRYLDSGNSLHH